MKAQDLKPGDRIRYESGITWDILETTKSRARCKCIAGGKYHYLGAIELFYLYNIPNTFQYLGNFAKSQNFSNLYELLNE